jgi:DNA polymerase-3 subunit beta
MPSITIEPKALADALAAVKPALGRRNTIGALTGVRLTTSATGSHLAATDLDVFVQNSLPDGEIEGKLDCVVAHHELADVAKVFAKEGCLTLALESGEPGCDRLVCSHEQRKVALQTLRLQDFPLCPAPDGRHLFTADGAELAAALERVGRFASTDETRPIACGISVDWNDGLVLVATDSKRLAAIPAPAAPKVSKRAERDRQDDPNRVTIGGRGLLLAAKAMRKTDSVRVVAGDTHAILEWQGNLWAIRLVNGLYPRWRNLIPDKFPHTIKIPVSELVQASELAAKFLPDSTPARLLVNGGVKLHGGTHFGPAFEQILKGASAQLADQDTFEIGFNAEFLRTLAGTYVSDIAIVRLTNPRGLVLFEDRDDRYLLMPIDLDRR